MSTFTEDFTRLRDDCDRSRQDRRQFYQDVRTAVQEIEEEAHAFLDEFRDNHAEMATQLRSDLADFAGELKAGGEIFRNGHLDGQAARFPKTKSHKAKKSSKKSR